MQNLIFINVNLEVLKMIRINGCYFDKFNKYGIRKTFNNKWDVYKLEDNFKSYYVITFKYLKDAKKYVMQQILMTIFLLYTGH